MNRKCEVCGKEDMDTNVCGSSIGPMSMNYCLVCMSVHAEDKSVLDAISDGHPKDYNFDEIKYYDSENDLYRSYKDDSEFLLITTAGRIFRKRKEFVDYFKSL